MAQVWVRIPSHPCFMRIVRSLCVMVLSSTTPLTSPSSPSSLLSHCPSFCPSTSSSRMWWANSLCTSANEDRGTLAEYDPLTVHTHTLRHHMCICLFCHTVLLIQLSIHQGTSPSILLCFLTNSLNSPCSNFWPISMFITNSLSILCSHFRSINQFCTNSFMSWTLTSVSVLCSHRDLRDHFFKFWPISMFLMIFHNSIHHDALNFLRASHCDRQWSFSTVSWTATHQTPSTVTSGRGSSSSFSISCVFVLRHTALRWLTFPQFEHVAVLNLQSDFSCPSFSTTQACFQVFGSLPCLCVNLHLNLCQCPWGSLVSVFVCFQFFNPLPSVLVCHKSCKSHLCTNSPFSDVFGFHNSGILHLSTDCWW